MSQIMWNTTTTFAQRISLITNGTRYIIIRYIYKKNPYLFKFYFNLTSISLEIKLNKLQEVFRLDMVSSNNTNALAYGEDKIVSIKMFCFRIFILSPLLCWSSTTSVTLSLRIQILLACFFSAVVVVQSQLPNRASSFSTCLPRCFPRGIKPVFAHFSFKKKWRLFAHSILSRIYFKYSLKAWLL